MQQLQLPQCAVRGSWYTPQTSQYGRVARNSSSLITGDVITIPGSFSATKNNEVTVHTAKMKVPAKYNERSKVFDFDTELNSKIEQDIIIDKATITHASEDLSMKSKCLN